MRNITILYLCEDYNDCHCHSCDPCKHTTDLAHAANWNSIPSLDERLEHFDRIMFDDHREEIWIEKENKDEET